MLKVMNVNRNQDLAEVNLGYCPMLDTLSASYCSLKSIGDMASCPNLQQIDVSFNQIQTIECLLKAIYTN